MGGRSPPTPLYILRGAGSMVTSLNFSPKSDQILFSGTLSGKVHIWDLKNRRVSVTFDAHNGHSVQYLHFEPHTEVLLTQGREGCLKIWKIKESEQFLAGEIPSASQCFCSGTILSGDNSSPLIALPSQVTSQVNIYELGMQTLVQTLSPCPNNNLGMCMTMCSVSNSTGNASSLLVGYENGSIKLWDVMSGKELHEMKTHSETLMAMSYSSSCNKGLSASVNDELVAWAILPDLKLQTLSKVQTTNAGFNSILIRPDDKIFATAGWDYNVRLFSLKKFKPLAVLSYHRGSMMSLAFSQNHFLAAGSKDQLISLWDIYR